MRNVLLSLLVLTSISLSAATSQGALSGRFTINNDGDQIVFSQGNLQFNNATGIWSFATNQYDVCRGTTIEDLFTWTTQDDETDDAFKDWGTNAISNGGNEANLWRTLTRDEWCYIFCGRANTAVRFGYDTVAGVYGLVLLPDNWTIPTEMIPTACNSEQWKELEANGAVFLPSAGYKDGGYYWSSTPAGSSDAYRVYVYKGEAGMGNSYRSYHYSVRLVQDCQKTTAISNVQSDKVQCTKTLRNGQLLIEKNGQIYTIDGRLVR